MNNSNHSNRSNRSNHSNHGNHSNLGTIVTIVTIVTVVTVVTILTMVSIVIIIAIVTLFRHTNPRKILMHPLIAYRQRLGPSGLERGCIIMHFKHRWTLWNHSQISESDWLVRMDRKFAQGLILMDLDIKYACMPNSDKVEPREWWHICINLQNQFQSHERKVACCFVCWES